MKKLDHMNVWTERDNLEIDEMSCPACGEEIIMDELLKQQFAAKMDKELTALKRQLRKEFLKDQEQLRKEKESLEKDKLKLQEIMRSEIEKEKYQLQRQFNQEREKVIEQTKHELKEQFEKEADAVQQQKIEIEQARNELRKKEIKVLEEKQLWLKEQERQKLQLREAHIKEIQYREDTLRKEFDKEKSFLQIEFEKKIADQKKLVTQMQNKIGQGSMKLQGTVQELAIADYLQRTFPEDVIQPVKSGAKGADCLQVVRSFDNKACGKLYYESKRTKTFQNAWIEKLKADQAAQKADIAILVTEVYPKRMNRMGIMNGIWICSFDEFKGLSIALRDSLIRVHQVNQAHSSKADEINRMYQYLASNEFRLQMEHIVDGFLQLQDQLAKEKRTMAQIWKKREKQIEKVLLNTNDMYHSIKDIAGDTVQDVPALDLANMQGKLL